MLASDLDFFLPPESIAQQPFEPRDHARLLHLQRARVASTPAHPDFPRSTPRVTPAAIDAAISHHVVCDLPALLRAGDLLVFNDTRVLRARLFGHKPSGGRVELLLLKEFAPNEWEALLKPSARLREGGEVLLFLPDGASLVVRLQKRLSESWRVCFELRGDDDIRNWLPQLGEVPIPPYIKSKPREEQYQTVYSQSRAGQNHPLDSAAAPTAGLHFTPRLLEELQAREIQTCFVTLGVGAGTFRPVQTETLESHPMHAEEFEVGEETAARINAQKSKGGRVISVGTTTTRVLESRADENGHIAPGYGSTSIFIRPGFRFRCVDVLMTNFHLPRSTLLALVATFIQNGLGAQSSSDEDLTGLEIVRYAYEHAIAQGYRFFSFGDAMLID